MLLAAYLANPPRGAPLVYLVMSVTLLALAVTWAGWDRDPWRVMVALALGLLVLALLTH